MSRKADVKKMVQIVVAEQLIGISFQLFLFGSQSNLSVLKNADIGIDAERQLTATEINSIKSKLDDLPTLYEFDVVDFNKVTNNFKNIALKNIELIV